MRIFWFNFPAGGEEEQGGGGEREGDENAFLPVALLFLLLFMFFFFSFKLKPQPLDSNKLNPMAQWQPLHHTGDFRPCMIAVSLIF